MERQDVWRYLRAVAEACGDPCVVHKQLKRLRNLIQMEQAAIDAGFLEAVPNQETPIALLLTDSGRCFYQAGIQPPKEPQDGKGSSLDGL